jgi:bifunctional UDP-N-acetylglucosamine pyrophosphorylase / glucosamine-1-phosphate N-acetyltransferase
MIDTAPVAVVLAAGKSTRMKSDTPKVLHRVCGQLMIDYVLDAARAAGAKQLVVVVGHRADLVRAALSRHADVVFAEQTEQKGTGHAVLMCERFLADHRGSTLILAGDTPLLQGASLADLLNALASHHAACVVGTADTGNNDGLGRVVRDDHGKFIRIVEQKDATSEQCCITEINTGCYAFETQRLLESLHQVRPNNVQSEYYLTDCPQILMDNGHAVVASCSLTIGEALGVNTRVQLAEARADVQRHILNQHMLNGVTIEDPLQTTIDQDVVIAADTLVRPGCVIDGGVKFGRNCVVGPHAVVRGPATFPDGSIVG